MRGRTFAEYHDQYPHIEMTRDPDGILLMRFHGDEDDAEFEWGFDNHHEVAFSWRDVGADPENKVVILTGTGDAFLRREVFKTDRDLTDPVERALNWIDACQHGRRLEIDMLEIDAPMIAALNGPCGIHVEIPLLCDVVLAAEHTVLADHVHYDYGFVPGDGVHTVLIELMGLNRARYFMLMGQELGAHELKDLGLINEVLPADQVLPRAFDVARHILRAPAPAVQLFRPTVLQDIKQKMITSVASGLMFEGLAQAAEFPRGHVRATPIASD
jgi:enoyl-CoA hydratase/carnithine racemase